MACCVTGKQQGVARFGLSARRARAEVLVATKSGNRAPGPGRAGGSESWLNVDLRGACERPGFRNMR